MRLSGRTVGSIGVIAGRRGTGNLAPSAAATRGEYLVKSMGFVTVRVEAPTAADCEKDVTVVGEFTHEDDEAPLRLMGYCDSEDASLFRVGFVPQRPGEYSWRVVYRQGEFQRAGTGSVTVIVPERRP